MTNCRKARKLTRLKKDQTFKIRRQSLGTIGSLGNAQEMLK